MHAYFILHYLRIEGLMLDPEHCFQCGGIPVKAYFLPLMGQMLCGNCQKDHAPVWELPDMLLSLLNMMMHADVVQMEKQKIADADITLLNRLVWNTLASRFDSCRTLKSVEILRKVL
ncbi:MAG: DNA repair protein RecO C-terminal domain-containing protein, partial [Candidatus Marinimicrobia bacterium]|nr:DNA repair protein RecO C-terminal domain-containing protein [Candidatus Neomarinimicrobiota bacterium]